MENIEKILSPKLKECTLDFVMKLSADELKQFGVTPKKIENWFAIRELIKQSQEQKLSKVINSAQAAVDIFKLHLENLHHEEFHIMFLDRKLKIIKYEAMFKGGQTATTVDTKLILKNALLLSAYGIICAHNHPSGETKPSEMDDNITAKIKSQCAIMEINFLDHIIIGNNKFYSYYS